MNVGRFYPSNNEYDVKYSGLRNSFKARMNGATEGQMKGRGINYRVNFGVSIPHIKELSAKFSFTPLECERLWFNEIRESMIVAAIQMPDDRLDFDTMKSWSSCIKNIDIAEQSAFFLFCRMPKPDSMIEYMANSGNKYLFATAFFTLGRIIQSGMAVSDAVVDVLMGHVDDDWPATKSVATRSVSFFLRQALRKNVVSKERMLAVVKSCEGDVDAPCRQLAEELLTEIQYLDSL